MGITGYRELNESELALINEGKELAERVGVFVEKLNLHHQSSNYPDQMTEARANTDKRWVAIGRTHLQEGFMALTRAIARPSSF